MNGFTLAGSIGLGLVWGWLMAGLGAGARGSWSFRALLAALSLLAGLAVWTLAGDEALVAAVLAGVLALVLRLAWHRSLAAH